METSDARNYLKILCEIILKRDRDLFNQIRELKLSAIQNRAVLSDQLMEIVRERLIEWNIDIQSFESVTSKENSLCAMDYLIETIQSDFAIETTKLMPIFDILEKGYTTVDVLRDSMTMIPDLLCQLKSKVTEYKVNIERRINIYKPLQDFASDIYNIFNIIKRKLDNFPKRDVTDLNIELSGFMKQLLESSIVISTFPPRTVKKGTASKIGTHFRATTKCLIESEKLFSREEIQPYFLSEEDFRHYIKTKELKDDCLIRYGPKNFKSNIWELKNMLWNPTERQSKERRKSDRITNQKAIILFKFKALANPYLFGQFIVDISLYSDTVVSIVHTNQENEAMITLFWDDYFRRSRSAFLETGSFCCKDSVPINDIIDAMSQYFEKETSRALTLSNREFLFNKLSKSNRVMSLSQFGSHAMSTESPISFANWIMSIIKLLKIEGIFDMWKNNLIDGFMKKDSDSLFLTSSAGTFALRFSEKSPKIGVLLKTPDNSLEAWDPFDIEECRNRNLCERLMEFRELQWIRSASGEIRRKEDVLLSFIPNKPSDVGYTERGNLSRLLCSNIYLNATSNFDDNSETMDTDMFIGITNDSEDYE